MPDYEKAYRDLRAGVEALAVNLDRGDSIDRGIAAELRALLAPASASETARCVCPGSSAVGFLISADCAIHSPTAINTPTPAPTPPTTVQADQRDLCAGSASCASPLHVHGCYADDDGSACDDPDDHATGQADRDAGDDCPHGHPLPENCGLCTGCDS